MTSRREDWLFAALVVSWPFLLGIGIFLWLLDIPVAWGFLMYCVASSPGIAKAAIEIWRHGIHNDR